MPVFETGAFNHSATCPAEPTKLVSQKTMVNARVNPRLTRDIAGLGRENAHGSRGNSTL